MKKNILLLLSLLLLKISNAQTYLWTQKSNYGGVPIYSPFSFSIGNYGYVGGGKDIFTTYHFDFWQFEPALNVWTQKANCPNAAAYASRTFVIGNLGYVASGYSAAAGFSNEMWAYNTATNSWSQKAPHPGVGRYTSVAFTINNMGFMGMGSQFGNSYYNDLYEYNPLADSWSQKANFPGTLRQGASAFVINNYAYVGLGSNAPLNSCFNDFYKYDAINNSWSPIASFPGFARNAAFVFVLNSIAHITQGTNYTTAPPAQVFNDHWTYDTVNLWQALPNFPGQPHFEGAYFSIGNKGYIGLGSDTASFTHYMNDFWEYAPTVGINETENSENISLYPNPSGGIFYFKIKTKKECEFFIYDITGKLIMSADFKIKSETASMDLRKFAKGEYVYRIVSQSTVLEEGKLILDK